jgi:hypothetical protein
MEPGMKSVSAPTVARTGAAPRGSEEWRERAGRLYEEPSNDAGWSRAASQAIRPR